MNIVIANWWVELSGVLKCTPLYFQNSNRDPTIRTTPLYNAFWLQFYLWLLYVIHYGPEQNYGNTRTITQNGMYTRMARNLSCYYSVDNVTYVNKSCNATSREANQTSLGCGCLESLGRNCSLTLLQCWNCCTPASKNTHCCWVCNSTNKGCLCHALASTWTQSHHIPDPALIFSYPHRWDAGWKDSTTLWALHD